MFMRAFASANSHLTLVSLSGAKVNYSTKQIQDLSDGISAIVCLAASADNIDSIESTTFKVLTVTTGAVPKNIVCTCRIGHRLKWEGHELSPTNILHIDGMLPRGRFSSNGWGWETPDNTVPNELFADSRRPSRFCEKVRAEGQRFQGIPSGSVTSHLLAVWTLHWSLPQRI